MISFDYFQADEGLIASHSGAKSVVNAMRQMGLSREEALELIAKLWEEEA